MLNHRSQDKYIKACNFAAKAHNGQLVPGTDLPYLVHLSLVSMEVIAALGADDKHDADLAMQCAWLHDTIEDTTTVTYENVKDSFGVNVADGVWALTKDTSLPKQDQMADSLKRIRQQSKEVWVVKMADRITNLQPPPHYWNQEKIVRYREEALMIHNALKDANELLAARLLLKANEYKKHIRET